MSLLIDALKRAEQEKIARKGQDSPPEESGGHADTAAEPARRRSLELEELASPAPASSASAAKREGDRAVFAAKQPAAAPASTAVSRHKMVIAIVAGALLLVAAGGAYVWHEISATKPGLARAPLPVNAPRPVTPAPQSAPPAETAVVAAATPKADAVPAVSVLKPGSLAASPGQSRPSPKAAEQLVMNLLKESADAKSAPPLKLSRTIDPPRVTPDVAQGYQALKEGDLATARARYEAAVAADATSVDAHLGLATAAARAGDRNVAARHFRRVLALDPRNPSALAGIAALADFTRPESVERQLRADLTQYPQSAALHFTLGNVYAAQSRWNEAQAAYFEAYRLDPDNADVVFNLAVSIDHLGQAKLATDFYQRALAAARQQNAQFDKGQVSRRIAELKP